MLNGNGYWRRRAKDGRYRSIQAGDSEQTRTLDRKHPLGNTGNGLFDRHRPEILLIEWIH